jgi:hypothetical protein
MTAAAGYSLWTCLFAGVPQYPGIVTQCESFGVPKSVNGSTNQAVDDSGSSAAHDAVMELP